MNGTVPVLRHRRVILASTTVVNVAYSRAGDDALDLNVRDPTFSGDVLSSAHCSSLRGEKSAIPFGRKYLKRESCASALVC